MDIFGIHVDWYEAALTIAAGIGYGLWLRVRHVLKQTDARIEQKRQRNTGGDVRGF